MLKNRIIPCLDVKNGRVVKGINFVELKDRVSLIYERDARHLRYQPVVNDTPAERCGRLSDSTIDAFEILPTTRPEASDKSQRRHPESAYH